MNKGCVYAMPSISIATIACKIKQTSPQLSAMIQQVEHYALIERQCLPKKSSETKWNDLLGSTASLSLPTLLQDRPLHLS